MDKEDSSITHTAIRETWEEVHVNVNENDILGELGLCHRLPYYRFIQVPSKSKSRVSCIIADLGPLDPRIMKGNPDEGLHIYAFHFKLN